MEVGSLGFVNDWRRRSRDSSFNHGGFKEDLFLSYCDKVENEEIIPSRTDSYDVVDNFYVNGDFIEREDESDIEWENKCCRMQAIVFNEHAAILKF